jgi:hypothetical protein
VRILLDECIDHRLAKDITGHEVSTVMRMGWGGKRNGELLGLAQERFDIFVMTDRNLISQQDLSKFHIAVLILAAPSNRLTDLRPLIPRLLQALPFSKSGESKVVSI